MTIASMLALWQASVLSAAVGSLAPPARADALSCDLTRYTGSAGLTAAVSGDVLTLAWDGDPGQEARLSLIIDDGVPTLQEWAVRRKGGAWAAVISRVTPEFRIVSGFRRITNQQLTPLRELGVEITQEIVDAKKWDAFWDAPLDLSEPTGRGGNPPPAAGVAGQPGLPRSPDEIHRATATYRAAGCSVKTDGARIEVSFPGLTLGVFSGRLQFTVYRGTNLVRMEAVATTDQPSVAYKYDAGLRGLTIREGARMVWRDLANQWQGYSLGGAANENPVALKVSNRIVMAQSGAGAIAAFPPPHTFFWAREVETNLGYGWYRKDGASSFAFGIRQAESEEEPRYVANTALYSAPPGSLQRMPVYLYATAGDAAAALESVLAFTRGDRYKALPGYQVMASHFHTDVGERLRESGSLDTRLPDFEALAAAGINIVSPTDRPRGAERLEILAAYFEGARRNADADFIVMPNLEVSRLLGGHWDLLFARPVFWTEERAAGQPLVEDHPTYGKLYHVGSPEDVMQMVTRENGLIFMPHPRTKGSTGYPDAVKDTDHFQHERYRGVGWRWGMGSDLSERRLSDFRVLPLLDDMNNWMADLPTPPKYLIAITETYRKAPGDDVYANNPVNYLRLASLPSPGDWSPIIDVLRRGDYFVTSGEVLIPSFALQGSGARRTVVADVEWTFPLEFVEVVWGDGTNTGREIISVTDLPPFGRHRFEIPLDARGKKWVRFAVWDSAGNGAMVQPIKLNPTGGTGDDAHD
ncbi:MAG: hypothetical protein HY701_11410 [Gemmatimonadetes bacterium]|nr:hypothetical protein [Gemmatimonadota bacterium]